MCKLIRCLLLFVLICNHNVFAHVSSPELDTNQPIPREKRNGLTEIKHVFWIKIWEEQSTLNYTLSPRELLSNTINADKPNIYIIGSLVLKYKNSTQRCRVKLPSSELLAKNSRGETISIKIKGSIGEQALSSEELIKPVFNEFNEVNFKIEGIIEPTFNNKIPTADQYSFAENLKLIVEFL